MGLDMCQLTDMIFWPETVAKLRVICFMNFSYVHGGDIVREIHGGRRKSTSQKLCLIKFLQMSTNSDESMIRLLMKDN